MLFSWFFCQTPNPLNVIEIEWIKLRIEYIIKLERIRISKVYIMSFFPLITIHMDNLLPAKNPYHYLKLFHIFWSFLINFFNFITINMFVEIIEWIVEIIFSFESTWKNKYNTTFVAKSQKCYFEVMFLVVTIWNV